MREWRGGGGEGAGRISSCIFTSRQPGAQGHLRTTNRTLTVTPVYVENAGRQNTSKEEKQNAKKKKLPQNSAHNTTLTRRAGKGCRSRLSNREQWAEEERRGDESVRGGGWVGGRAVKTAGGGGGG